MEDNRPIHAWKEDDRPREKLLLKGRHTLSDAELLAIILGTGSRYRDENGFVKSRSALDLGKDILHAVDNNLINLTKTTVSELTKVKGIGEAKAISILAALELGVRRSHNNTQKHKITCSKDGYMMVCHLIQDLPYEEFHAIFLNKGNYVLGIKRMSVGGTSATIMDPGQIFKEALNLNASGIVLCHNHPSGTLRPSDEDIAITRKLIDAGSFLDIIIMDHLIISSHGYYSFGDNGKMSRV